MENHDLQKLSYSELNELSQFLKQKIVEVNKELILRDAEVQNTIRNPHCMRGNYMPSYKLKRLFKR